MDLFSSHAVSVRCFISDWLGSADAIYYELHVMQYFLSYAARQWLMGPKVMIDFFSRSIQTPTNTTNNPHEAKQEPRHKHQYCHNAYIYVVSGNTFFENTFHKMKCGIK